MFYNVNSLYSLNTGASSQTNSSSENVLDKDAFLKLLVAELQNQNPLEPMDNKDFVSQMAQFTSMEQMTNMSQSLQSFLGSMESTGKLQASAVVGKFAVVEGKEINISGGFAQQITYTIETPSEVILQVKDEEGNIILEENLGFKEAGIDTFQWDGRNNDGITQEDGTYDYQLFAIDSEGNRVEFGGVKGGIVQAIQFRDNEIYILVSGERYNFKDIVEISEPPDSEEQA